MASAGNFNASGMAGFSGIEKAALLLLALGKTKATNILRRLDPEELKALTRSANSLRPVGASDVEALVEEFAQNFSNGVKFMGTETEIRDLLSDVMSEDEYNNALHGDTFEPMVAPIVAAAAASGRDSEVWDKVAKVKIEVLRAYLMAQHPQMLAVILSKLDSETSAKILSSFPGDMRSAVLVKMLGVKDADEEAISAIEATLAEDLLAEAAPTKHGGVADILNRLEKQQTEEVLQQLTELRPDDAKVLKNMLFTFEDMITLTPQARTLIMDQVPVEKLVMALRGTDSTFQAAILASLGARSRRMVEAELQSGGAGQPREVQDARRFIIDTVLRMNARGDIKIKPDDDLSDVAQ